MSDIAAHIFRQYDRTVLAGEGYRPGTAINALPINYYFNNSGMGDFICYTSALQWIAANCPWVMGRVYCSNFMIPFLQLALAPWPHWKAISGERVAMDLSECHIGPDIDINGQRYFQQLFNATGCHLVDLGFAYYANFNPAPKGATYPQMSFPAEKLPKELRGKEGHYVCFTPGAPTTSRTVASRHINPIIDYVLALGLTPVFLGKAQVTPTHQANFPADVSYEKGIDLRDKTTVLDAACIMEHSLCTLGLDNGLLHLASCTPGNVIFGYNIASPEHRRPRRGKYDNKTTDITVPREKLPCIHCQSNMKMLVTHSFHQCLYGDLKCIDLLFSEDGKLWKDAILAFAQAAKIA